MRKRWRDSHNCWCGAKNKWKGTKYYHGVTASQSRFQDISQSRKAVTIVIQLYLLLCKWDAQHDNSYKAMVMQVAATDHFLPIILSGWFFGCRAVPSSAIMRQRLQPTEVVQGLQEGASCMRDLPGDLQGLTCTICGAVENILLPATYSSLTSLVVVKWWSGEAHLWRTAHTRIILRPIVRLDSGALLVQDSTAPVCQ